MTAFILFSFFDLKDNFVSFFYFKYELLITEQLRPVNYLPQSLIV